MGSNEQQYGHFISFAKIRLGFNENGSREQIEKGQM